MTGLPVVAADAGSLVDTSTGEVVTLATADPEFLAVSLDQIKDWSSRAREAKLMLEGELIRRLSEAVERSIDAGLFVAEQTERREWDPEATWSALGDLVAAGLVSAKEADEAMPEVTVRKASGVKLNALLGRLVGDDPVAAGPLARARSSRVGVKLARRAVDSSVEEAA